MTDHASRTVERHCDVVVIGGSASGLAAALELGRQRRSVIVVDSGGPHGAAVVQAYGDPGHEDVAAWAPAAVACEEVRSYGVEVLAGQAVAAKRLDDRRLWIALAGGNPIVTRRVLIATGWPHEVPIESDSSVVMLVTGTSATADVTGPGTQGLEAAADGNKVGATMALSLAQEDLVSHSWQSGNQTDWEHRYDGDPIWSGRPNGSLVRETSGLRPGRALDVGAGEGGDALWLAEQGWEVTASDISVHALQRIQAEATRRGLEVDCRHADANASEPFPRAAFDLVSAHYASIPRTPDYRGVHNLIYAVGPGGLLLVVGHDLEPMRRPIDTRQQSRAFDPDAYLRTDDFAAVLDTEPGWEIEAHGKRPRLTATEPASTPASPHVDDVILRARRLGS